MNNELEQMHSKIDKLNRLIQSTSFSGEKTVANKKYIELKRKYSIIRALVMWCKPTDAQINEIYDTYCRKYNDLFKKTSCCISPDYLDATMSHWDYGFTVGLSKYKWKRTLNLPYSPYALDFYLLGNANGFRSSLVISC